MKRQTRIRCATFLLVAAAAPAVATAVMRIDVGSITAAPGASVEAPVSISEAKDLGSLQFDLLYDPTLLEPFEPPVKAGAALAGAMIEANAGEPGRLRVAMISGEPVNGAGEILLVAFTVPAGAAGSGELTPAAIRAWDHANNLDMLVESAGGTATIAPRQPLALWIGIAAVAVVLFIVLVALARRKTPAAAR